MRPFQDGDSRSHHCEVHASDTWLLIDALITIVASVVTIVVLIVRHPFYSLLTAALILIVATALGWW